MNRSQENADPSAYIDEFDIQAIVKVSFEWEIVKMFKNAHKQKKSDKGLSLGRISLVIQLFVRLDAN